MLDNVDGQGDLDVRRGFQAVVFGLLAANGLAVLIGFVAKSLHDTVDRPLYDRLDAAGESWLTDLLKTVTKMGNERPTQVLAVVGAVVLAVWFARQGWRWWVPLIIVPLAWIAARGFQLMLTRVIDRERGVMALTGDEIGGHPSGGVARIVLISGLLAFLAVHYGGLSRRASRALFFGVAILGIVEGFARLRLNQHWFTDIVGGACFGAMLLAVAIITVRVSDPNHLRPPRRPDGITVAQVDH